VLVDIAQLPTQVTKYRRVIREVAGVLTAPPRHSVSRCLFHMLSLTKCRYFPSVSSNMDMGFPVGQWRWPAMSTTHSTGFLMTDPLIAPAASPHAVSAWGRPQTCSMGTQCPSHEAPSQAAAVLATCFHAYTSTLKMEAVWSPVNVG
jgi:hypothetical protein